MDNLTKLQTYAELMDAIKQRHQLLIGLLNNQSALPPWSVVEFSQLQIRMLCETLAIACLVAHGDMEGAQSSKLTNAYQADFIMNALEKLHPYFFPRPVTQILENGKPIALEDVKEGFLTKSDLLKSYRNTSDFLHMGGLKDALSRRQKPFSLNSVLDWSKRFLILLNAHQIYLVDPPGQPKGPVGHDGVPVPKYQLAVIMHNAADGRPYAHMFERVDRA